MISMGKKAIVRLKLIPNKVYIDGMVEWQINGIVKWHYKTTNCWGWVDVMSSGSSIAKDPSGLDSDRWIPLRGGARIPRGL